MGDDLVNLFYKWKAQAVANDGGLPYFATDGWKGATKPRNPRSQDTIESGRDTVRIRRFSTVCIVMSSFGA